MLSPICIIVSLSMIESFLVEVLTDELSLSINFGIITEPSLRIPTAMFPFLSVQACAYMPTFFFQLSYLQQEALVFQTIHLFEFRMLDSLRNLELQTHVRLEVLSLYVA